MTPTTTLRLSRESDNTLKIRVDIDGDGVVGWLNENTDTFADGENDQVSGKLTDVLDAVIHNIATVIEGDDD